MTFPSTDWCRMGISNSMTVPNTGLSSTQDRADWDNDTLRLALYVDASFSQTYVPSTTFAYDITATQAYASSGTASFWATGNGEVPATGGYNAGGFTLAAVSLAMTSTHKLAWTIASNTQIGTGVTIASFTGGLIYDSSTTTKWALAAYNFGGPWALSSGNTITINWPTVDSTNKVLFYIG